MCKDFLCVNIYAPCTCKTPKINKNKKKSPKKFKKKIVNPNATNDDHRLPQLNWIFKKRNTNSPMEKFLLIYNLYWWTELSFVFARNSSRYISHFLHYISGTYTTLRSCNSLLLLREMCSRYVDTHQFRKNRTHISSAFSRWLKNDVLKEKSFQWKNLHAWQTIVFVKQEKIGKKINKAYYGKNENVTHVNIFVGGTFPLTYIVFYPPWKSRWYVRSFFPKLVSIDIPSKHGCSSRVLVGRGSKK